MSTSEQLLERLALQPHPEGGFYRQTWQSATCHADGRALASSIFFLLPTGVRSHWHRTDGEETGEIPGRLMVSLEQTPPRGHVIVIAVPARRIIECGDIIVFAAMGAPDPRRDDLQAAKRNR